MAYICSNGRYKYMPKTKGLGKQKEEKHNFILVHVHSSCRIQSEMFVNQKQVPEIATVGVINCFLSQSPSNPNQTKSFTIVHVCECICFLIPLNIVVTGAYSKQWEWERQQDWQSHSGITRRRN